MKNYICCLACIIFSAFWYTGTAQEIKRQCVSSLSTETGTSKLPSTVGQPFFTENFHDNGIGVTQGFQQPTMFSITPVLPKKDRNSSISLSPCPAYNSFEIRSKNEIENATIVIRNSAGITISETNLDILLSQVIMVDTWKNGMYFISIISGNKILSENRISIIK